MAESVDTAIEAHWAVVKEKMLQAEMGPEEAGSPEWWAVRHAGDDALYGILALRPTSVRGAMIQLLCGITEDEGSTAHTRPVQIAALTEDIAALSKLEEDDKLDWGLRFLIRALATLSHIMEQERG